MNLFDKPSRLRLRRLMRRQQRQVESVAEAADRQFSNNLIGRFDRLLRVRRFALGWIALIVLAAGCTVVQTLALSGYYQTVRPVAGGIYNEGMVGTYSNANPIFASGAVDTAVSRLLFAGLFKYDKSNHLVGDLASNYSVDQAGKRYTVKLHTGLTWHDGQPLTAQDVVFTYKLIQNPDVQSPLLQSWQNVQISAVDKQTVVFELPGAFAAFPYNLTTGLLPEHILSAIPAAQLRSNAFNATTPVGAGPFVWRGLQASTAVDPEKAASLIALKPFDGYVGGRPKLSGFVLHAYGSEPQLVAAYQGHEVQAMAGLDQMPSKLSTDSGSIVHNFSSTAAVMSFFKTSNVILSDVTVRQALVQGADTAAIVKDLGYQAKLVKQPFLQGQFGYDTKYLQAPYDVSAANANLEKAGWTRTGDQIRSKGGQKLMFRLYAEDTPDNRVTAKALVADWRRIGVNAIPVLQPLTDFQTTLEFHTYDALLYNVSIGVDPDVYAYWDSSQADIRSTSRLNFSEYKSATADAALEAGRTRLDPELRNIKYKPFLQAWQADAPALGLYQPRFLYVTNGPVYGMDQQTLNVDADRYYSVANWQIHTAKVTND